LRIVVEAVNLLKNSVTACQVDPIIRVKDRTLLPSATHCLAFV